MHFEILTLFPEMFSSYFGESILKRAQEKDIISFSFVNIRDFAQSRHRIVDDRPFGGGDGMVMKPEPVYRAICHARNRSSMTRVILMGAHGRVFNHKIASELSEYPDITLLCGRYEGVDERIRQYYIDEEISVGDYILTGGELAAMIVVDAVARLVTGVLGNPESSGDESFSEGLLEYPQYTRPRVFMDKEVPDVLLSGDHKKIDAWRRMMSLERTEKIRPDLAHNVSDC